MLPYQVQQLKAALYVLGPDLRAALRREWQKVAVTGMWTDETLPPSAETLPPSAETPQVAPGPLALAVHRALQPPSGAS